jgi:hypothetical protein
VIIERLMTAVIKSLTFNTITAYNKSNPLFTLPNPLISSDGYAVQSFSGINSFYTIDSRNSAIAFIEDDEPTATITFNIPTGNYTLNTFIAALQTGLNANGTDTYTVTNNTLTNKITITGTSKTFKIVYVPSNCYYESGFEVSSAFALAHTATSTYDLSGIKTIYISSNSLGYGQSLIVNKNLNIICSISVSTPYLGVISYNPSIVFISSQISEISSIEFYCLMKDFDLQQLIKIGL